MQDNSSKLAHTVMVLHTSKWFSSLKFLENSEKSLKDKSRVGMINATKET